MANKQHLDILKQGVAEWNRWRADNPDTRPDLREADLHKASLFGSDTEPQLSHIDFHEATLFKANFSGSDLRRANLCNADLRWANLSYANLHEASLNEALLREADLSHADLTGALLMEADLSKATLFAADLREADLSGATLARAVLDKANLSRATLRRTFLRKANLVGAELSSAFLSDADLGEVDLTEAKLNDAHLRGVFVSEANLTGADLTGANLMYARFVDVNLQSANIANCAVYGISAWDLLLDNTKQSDLIITRPEEPTITVDNLEVAQFIYMLLTNRKIREVIQSITSKAVLILGRFTPERKAGLDALREELRKYNYLPILFDFDRPASRNLTETISTLAHLSRFVIADITEAKSIPQELQRIIPSLPSLPVQPLLLASEYEYGMFKDLEDYPWVLKPYKYDSLSHLLDSLEEKVIAPAEAKAKEIENRRRILEEEMKGS
jgi:uncharacterized protein YjbI with pentapeptide repeats